MTRIDVMNLTPVRAGEPKFPVINQDIGKPAPTVRAGEPKFPVINQDIGKPAPPNT